MTKQTGPMSDEEKTASSPAENAGNDRDDDITIEVVINDRPETRSAGGEEASDEEVTWTWDGESWSRAAGETAS